MYDNFISFKRQIKLGCIPFFGNFIIIIIAYINFCRASFKGKLLTFLIGFPILGLGFYAISLLLNFANEDTWLLNYSIILLVTYLMSAVIIFCQLIIYKIIGKNKFDTKRINEKDKSKYV